MAKKKEPTIQYVDRVVYRDKETGWHIFGQAVCGFLCGLAGFALIYGIITYGEALYDGAVAAKETRDGLKNYVGCTNDSNGNSYCYSRNLLEGK